MDIYYFGKPCSFSHIASLKRFGEDNNFISKKSIDGTIDSLIISNEKNSLAIVPIENTYGGVITDTVDALFKLHNKKSINWINIKEELEMKIELYLLGKEKINFDRIKKIYSNEHALRESKEWLEKYIPTARAIKIGSTSEATSQVQKEKYSYAIASSEAAKQYNLVKLARIDAGEKRNLTRFFVLARQ